jgi:peptide-methionine (S)-S-oxide reductase
MGQGNDMGTQYRSAIVVSNDEQMRLALASRDRYQVCVCLRVCA